MNVNKNKRDFTEALEALRNELEHAMPAVDELNGRLNEVTLYEDDKGRVDGLIDEINEVYMTFPTWSQLEEYRDKINGVLEVFESENKEAKQ